MGINSSALEAGGSRRTAIRGVLGSRRALITTFIALHAVFLVALAPVMVAGAALGDLPLYRHWALEALQGNSWAGIDRPWVYPIAALVPVVLPAILGAAPYQFVWFLLLTAANGVSLWILTDGGRRRSAYPAAWWWMAILLILSPVALLRLEAFTSPLVIVALVLISARPALASVLLTFAAWIKVWPAAVILSAVIVSARRRMIAITAAIVSVGIVGAALMAGSGSHVLSFLTEQDSRGLQLESPLSTPWLWMAIQHVPGAEIYQNWALETREVAGPGDTWMIENASVLMVIAVIVIAGLLIWAHAQAPTRSAHLLLVGALALTTAFVVFNKVGSPQYMLWLAPIVVGGLANGWRTWRLPATLMAIIAVATTVVFPLFYMPLIAGDPAAATVLGIRNLLLVVLLGWAVWEIVRVAVTAPALAAHPTTRSIPLPVE